MTVHHVDPRPASRLPRRRQAMLAPFLLTLLSLTWSGCEQREEVLPAEVPVVSAVTPMRQTLVRTILQPGFVLPYEQTPIYARVPGYVEAVYVDIGDHVKKGAPLTKLWVPELVQDLNSKTARVDQAEAQVKQTRANLKAAEANVETAKAQLAEADAGVPRRGRV